MRAAHVLHGAPSFPSCGACGQPVTRCLMHLGACAGNGYVHLRSRLHRCPAPHMSMAWALERPSCSPAPRPEPLEAGDRITYTGLTFRGQTGTITAVDGRVFVVVLDSGEEIACTALSAVRCDPGAKAVRR